MMKPLVSAYPASMGSLHTRGLFKAQQETVTMSLLLYYYNMPPEINCQPIFHDNPRKWPGSLPFLPLLLPLIYILGNSYFTPRDSLKIRRACSML